MKTLLKTFVNRQNQFQQILGHVVAWGVLSLVLLSALVVILRYGFDAGSIALQESVIYNHALVFMLGIGYALQQDKHVRVDVFYETMSVNRKAWVDLLGSLFLTLPTLLFIFWASWAYVSASWMIHETSAEPGGLAYVYLLKTVILIMAVLSSLQSLAVAASAGLSLCDKPVPQHTDDESLAKL